MSVKVTKNFGNLADIPLSSEAMLRELLLLARERVIRRTLAGQSADGGAFRPYSRGYAAAKQQALGSSTPVNLQVSGRMLQDIAIVSLSDVKGELGFKS